MLMIRLTVLLIHFLGERVSWGESRSLISHTSLQLLQISDILAFISTSDSQLPLRYQWIKHILQESAAELGH